MSNKKYPRTFMYIPEAVEELSMIKRCLLVHVPQELVLYARIKIQMFLYSYTYLHILHDKINSLS